MKKIEKSMVILIVLFLFAPFMIESLSSKTASPGLTSSNYSSASDTIYVKGGEKTLLSIYQNISDDDVFYYDSANNTYYCHSNMTIEGSLNITSKILYFDHKKTLQINSTGTLNVSASKIAGIPEDKRWWKGENRYNIHKNQSGGLFVENSKIEDTGWADDRGARGIEIYGPEIKVINSTISSGLNGFVLYDTGDMMGQKISNITFKNMDNTGILLKSGTNFLTVQNSTFEDNGGDDVRHESSGNITLMNCSIEDRQITAGGHIKKGYYQDFLFRNGTRALENEGVQFTPLNEGDVKSYVTDSSGKLYDIPFIWNIENTTSNNRRVFNVTADNRTTYFSPSSYNFLEINTSESERIFISNVTTSPSSFVPVNNSLDPQNITLTADVHNDLSKPYDGNITFFYGAKNIGKMPIIIPADTTEKVSLNWTPAVDGYQKIRAEIDLVRSISEDNLRAWSGTFFAGYYNETIVPYENKTEKAIQMMEWGVKNEDADGYYTIYEDWLPDILMEMGLAYYGAHKVTGNGSYYERGKDQIDYALGFRDEWGLYNYSTYYEIMGQYEDTYYEWDTHRNVRSALTLQHAYLYTENETYLNFSDKAIDFILNKVYMENITFHDGVNYTVPWRSTKPNGGSGGVKGTSKNFPFVPVNQYVQLGLLLLQAYYEEDYNSSYYHDDRLLPYINTCMEYIVNDQIDSGDSIGTWPYFSYYDDINSDDPLKRRPMKYAALTAKELARANTYLRWDNISLVIENYTDYVEEHLTLRSAIDTHNGGSATITTYNSWRSLYNTTGRNVTKIDNILFSNIFFNDDGTVNGFNLKSDRYIYDTDLYGFLYIHYNPLRTLIWDDHYQNRSSLTYDITLESGGESGGWNYISTPLVPNQKNLSSILNDPVDGISDSYDKVMYYEASQDKWRTHGVDRKPKFNDIEGWDHEMGIWIHMTKDDVLTIQGPHPYRTTLSLKPGWNMVGYPSNTERTASEILPSNITKLAVFNSTEQYNLEYLTDLSTLTLKPGEGYWLYNGASDDVRWTIDY